MVDKKRLEELVKEESSLREALEGVTNDPYNPEYGTFFGERIGSPLKYAGVSPDALRFDLGNASRKAHKDLLDYTAENVQDLVENVDEKTLFDLTAQILDKKLSNYVRLMNAPQSSSRIRAMASELEKSKDYSSYYNASVNSEKIAYEFSNLLHLEFAKAQKVLGEDIKIGKEEVFVLDGAKVKEYFADKFKEAESSQKEIFYRNLAYKVLEAEKKKEKSNA